VRRSHPPPPSSRTHSRGKGGRECRHYASRWHTRATMTHHLPPPPPTDDPPAFRSHLPPSGQTQRGGEGGAHLFQNAPQTIHLQHPSLFALGGEMEREYIRRGPRHSQHIQHPRSSLWIHLQQSDKTDGEKHPINHEGGKSDLFANFTHRFNSRERDEYFRGAVTSLAFSNRRRLIFPDLKIGKKRVRLPSAVLRGKGIKKHSDGHLEREIRRS
jgi:hypothetical protein